MAPVKLAQQGFDVNTCGDENLIFSSQWPLLKIYKQGSFTISDVNQSQVITGHDLGFPAMYWVFNNVDVTSEYLNSGTIQSQARSDFGNNQISITNSQLLYKTNAPFQGTSGSLQGYYYIFANDLTQQFIAPVNNVGGQPTGASPNRAFKIAKRGASVHSTNLKDFVIHSDTRSPLIHSVNPGVVSPEATGDFAFSVEHDLGYAPMFFGYTLQADNSYQLLFTGSGGSTLFTANESQVVFRTGSSSKTLTIVVLKDPFLVNYNVSVTR